MTEFKRLLDRTRLFVFDADDTLRRCTVPGQPCPNAPGEWELIPGVADALARIDWGRKLLGIASNQAGVAYGYMDETVAYQLLANMVVEAIGRFPSTGCIQVCTHHPDDGCDCRKPEPGMLLRLLRTHFVPPKKALFVGDMESDREAAGRAGMPFMWAGEFFDLLGGM